MEMQACQTPNFFVVNLNNDEEEAECINGDSCPFCSKDDVEEDNSYSDLTIQAPQKVMEMQHTIYENMNTMTTNRGALCDPQSSGLEISKKYVMMADCTTNSMASAETHPIQTLATVSNDGIMHDVLSSHAISQTEVCNDNHVQIFNARKIQRAHEKRTTLTLKEYILPQNIQNKAREKLNAIITMHKKTKSEWSDYKVHEALLLIKAQYRSIFLSSQKINKHIGHRATQLCSYLNSPNYRMVFHNNKKQIKRSQQRTKKIKGLAITLGLTELSNFCTQMDAYHELIIQCIDETRSSHNQIIKESQGIKVSVKICNSNDISPNLVKFLLNDLIRANPEHASVIQNMFSLNLQQLDQLNDECKKQLHNISTNNELTNLNKIIQNHNFCEQMVRNMLEMTTTMYASYSIRSICNALGQRINEVLQCNDYIKMNTIRRHCVASLRGKFVSQLQDNDDPNIKNLSIQFKTCYSCFVKFIESFRKFLRYHAK